MNVCIALHDVAPTTWPACKRILAMVQSLGAPPITLLVVPDFHGRGRIDACIDVRRGLHACELQGHEIALHGYRHLDESGPARDVGEWFRRRILTADEGEFAVLDEADAFLRIDAGLRMLRHEGWTVSGFVPPAWLGGPGALRAVKRSGLRYLTTHRAILDLHNDCAISAPVITASVRSRWRRHASRFWLQAAGRLLSKSEIVRVGLHPADAHHPDVLDMWKSALTRLLATREAITKMQAVESCSRSSARGSTTP